MSVICVERSAIKAECYGVDFGISAACDTLHMGTVSAILFSSIETVCAWTLITRKGRSVRASYLLQVPAAKDDEVLSVVAVSDVWRRIPRLLLECRNFTYATIVVVLIL